MQEPAAYPTETPSNGYVTTPSLNPRVRRAEISEKISRTANDRGEHGLMAVWVPWHQARRLGEGFCRVRPVTATRQPPAHAGMHSRTVNG